jgi:ribosome-interacting GTPase 1
VPALVRIGGVLVQFVEIPGLIEGASDDRGGGRALLGVLRGADVIVYCQEASRPPDELLTVQNEVSIAGIERPVLIAATKADEASEADIERFRREATGLAVLPVSIIDDASLEALKEAVWQLTGLLRVYLRRGGVVAETPLAMPEGSTAFDVAAAIHNDLAMSFRYARVWGMSARFDGQQVGGGHVVQEGDVVEIVAG